MPDSKHPISAIAVEKPDHFVLLQLLSQEK